MIQLVDVGQFRIPPVGTMVEALRRVFESKMVECYEPLEDGREVVAFLGLGASWISSIGVLTDLLVEVDPACAEDARELACGYEVYCRRLERICSPEALRERNDAARRIISDMAAEATRNLGRDLSVFEVENSSLSFKVNSARPLESEPSIVGVWEVRALTNLEGT